MNNYQFRLFLVVNKKYFSEIKDKIIILCLCFFGKVILYVWYEYLNMKAGEKNSRHLEEIKKIEKNREERRIKMEEAKR